MLTGTVQIDAQNRIDHSEPPRDFFLLEPSKSMMVALDPKVQVMTPDGIPIRRRLAYARLKLINGGRVPLVNLRLRIRTWFELGPSDKPLEQHDSVPEERTITVPVLQANGSYEFAIQDESTLIARWQVLKEAKVVRVDSESESSTTVFADEAERQAEGAGLNPLPQSKR